MTPVLKTGVGETLRGVILISDTTKKLGEMHLAILKSAHAMDADRWVTVKRFGTIGTLERTDFGKHVGADEIHWWVTEKEPDLDELLAQTTKALAAGQSLKKASDKLKDVEVTSYENLLEALRNFTEQQKDEIAVLADYVAWLEKRDVMAPKILFTYRVWGSTRMGDRDMELDGIAEKGVSDEQMQTLIEIVLGAQSHGTRTYDLSNWELGWDIYQRLSPEEMAANPEMEIRVPEDRVVRRTTRVVLESCGTYFTEIRDSLRNIILDIEKFKVQRDLMQSDDFWREFIFKAIESKKTENQLWDFKETLNIWHAKDEAERRKAKTSFAEDIASFANSSGGVLIVGVTNGREIVGIGGEREIENRMKVTRDVIADFIEYDREIVSLRQVVMGTKGEERICLVVAVSQACEAVGASDGQGRFSYPVRRETGIERVGMGKVPTAELYLKSDNDNFLEDLLRFTRAKDR